MALSNQLNFLYNLRCCIGDLAYQMVQAEIVGRDTTKQYRKLRYLEFAFCAIEGYDSESDLNCFTEDEVDLIAEQVNQICGCCNCGSNLRTEDIPGITMDCELYEEEFNNLVSGNTIILTYDICDNTDVWVFRNGQRIDSFDEYTIDAATKTITFAEDFAVSSGGQGGEGVTVKYYK